MLLDAEVNSRIDGSEVLVPEVKSLSLYLDAGSTNTRAWLVRGSDVLARRAAAIGVRDSAREGATTRLRQEISRIIADLTVGHRPERVVAAGMITSSLGIQEVPHLLAPAGLPELAKGLVRIEAPDVTSLPTYFVPGIRTGHDDTDALDGDLMRGEETLAVGLLAAGKVKPGGAFLNAGSHWKLVTLNRAGEIARSRTSLGGEAVHAIQTGTILASALPEGPLAECDEMAVLSGAASARATGLLRTLFGVRLMEQRQQRSPPWRFSFLVGACVASDLDALLGEGLISSGAILSVTGPAQVPEVWATLLRRAGCEVVVLSPADLDDAFLRGLSAIESLAFAGS